MRPERCWPLAAGVFRWTDAPHAGRVGGPELPIAASRPEWTVTVAGSEVCCCKGVVQCWLLQRLVYAASTTPPTQPTTAPYHPLPLTIAQHVASSYQPCWT